MKRKVMIVKESYVRKGLVVEESYMRMKDLVVEVSIWKHPPILSISFGPYSQQDMILKNVSIPTCVCLVNTKSFKMC